MDRINKKPSSESGESLGKSSLIPILLSFVLTVATFFVMFVSLERGGPFAGMGNLLVYFWTGIFLAANWSLTLIILVLVPSWRRLAMGYGMIAAFLLALFLLCVFSELS